MTILKADALAHSFDYPLFHNLSFELKEGETMAIIGVSGSGKSTLLHILSTLLKPHEGTVTLLGRELYTLKGNDLVSIFRRRRIECIDNTQGISPNRTG